LRARTHLELADLFALHASGLVEHAQQAQRRACSRGRRVRGRRLRRRHGEHDVDALRSVVEQRALGDRADGAESGGVDGHDGLGRRREEKAAKYVPFATRKENFVPR
jgi:hypothetical protein